MAQHKLSTIATAFDILEYLSDARQAPPSEISDELNVPLSTAHSYLSTLEGLGYLVNEAGVYSISASILAIGERSRRNIDLYTVGKSVVDNLAAAIEEQVTLSIIENEKPIVIYNINKNENMTLRMHPGMVLPYHATVSGKLVLAFTSVKTDDLVSLEGYTPHTITERDELEEQIVAARERKVTFAYQEFKPKLMAIGVPIFHERHLHGALSAVGPLKQMTRSSVQESVIRDLETASNTIEVNLQNQLPM